MGVGGFDLPESVPPVRFHPPQAKIHGDAPGNHHGGHAPLCFTLLLPLKRRLSLNLNRRPAVVFGRTCPAVGGGRGQIRPPPPSLPNSTMGGRIEAGEAAIESSRRALLEHFLNFLKKSHVRLMPGQRSKPSLFTLSATEAGLIPAANPNFAHRLPKG